MAGGSPGGGWNDQRVRSLRTGALALLLGLLAWLVVVEPTNDLATIGTLIGAVLVILGFEAGVRLPPGKP